MDVEIDVPAVGLELRDLDVGRGEPGVGREVEVVRALGIDDRVAIARVDRVIARAALKAVRPLSAHENVVSVPAIERVFVRAPIEKVWDAIVDGSRTRQYFFGTAFESSLQPSAPFRYTFPDGTVAVSGRVLEVAKGARLVTTWVIHYDPRCANEETRVDWKLEARGDVTKLTVDHNCDGAPASSAGIRSDGWSIVLSGLKSLLETGRALQQIRSEAVDLSVMIASKIIQRNISKEDNERLIADALKQVEGNTH